MCIPAFPLTPVGNHLRRTEKSSRPSTTTQNKQTSSEKIAGVTECQNASPLMPRIRWKRSIFFILYDSFSFYLYISACYHVISSTSAAIVIIFTSTMNFSLIYPILHFLQSTSLHIFCRMPSPSATDQPTIILLFSIPSLPVSFFLYSPHPLFVLSSHPRLQRPTLAGKLRRRKMTQKHRFSILSR